MKNNELQKPNIAGKIGAAMATIRRSQQQTVRRPPAPEIFDLNCFCAVYDKPYTLRFVRQPSGLLRFKESIRGKPAAPASDPAVFAIYYEGGVKVGWKLSMKFFENTATPCAWCGNGTFHDCALDCLALVCGGRMKGNTFHCRRSCGASWVGIPLQEVNGHAIHESSRLTSPRAKRILSAPRGEMASKPRLLLSAAKTGGQ